MWSDCPFLQEVKRFCCPLDLSLLNLVPTNPEDGKQSGLVFKGSENGDRTKAMLSEKDTENII